MMVASMIDPLTPGDMLVRGGRLRLRRGGAAADVGSGALSSGAGAVSSTLTDGAGTSTAFATASTAISRSRVEGWNTDSTVTRNAAAGIAATTMAITPRSHADMTLNARVRHEPHQSASVDHMRALYPRMLSTHAMIAPVTIMPSTAAGSRPADGSWTD